jgi:peptidylprolyl isomerase
MRRVLALAIPLVLFAVSCGSDAGGNSADTTVAAPDTAGAATTTTIAKPTVSIPTTPVTQLVVTDLTTGTGPAAKTGDSVVLHYVGVRSADGTEFDNSYDRGEPFEVLLGAGKVIQGWEQGLIGVQAGGRRQMDIPAELAYGDQGSGDVIKPGDALSFVVDVLAVVPGTQASDQPQITVAPAANVPVIQSTDLIVGTGVSPVNGNKFATQIILYRADTGELLNSTWGTPAIVFDYTANSNTYPGIIAVAKGMKVGGRRQSQVPFQLMFDGKGNDTLQLPAGIDLVIVMDLVAVY